MHCLIWDDENEDKADNAVDAVDANDDDYMNASANILWSIFALSLYRYVQLQTDNET